MSTGNEENNSPPAVNDTNSENPARRLSINTNLKASETVEPKRIPTPSRTTVGRWTQEEHQLFLEGYQKHGKSWKTIAKMIRTRTLVQIRTHAQKFLAKQQVNNERALGYRSPTSIGIKRPSPHAMHQPFFFPMADPYLYPLGQPMPHQMQHMPWMPTTIDEHSPDDFNNLSFGEFLNDDSDTLDVISKLDELHTTSPTPNTDTKFDFDVLPFNESDENLDWLADCISTDLETIISNEPAIPSTNGCSIAPKPLLNIKTPDSPMKKRRLQPAPSFTQPTQQFLHMPNMVLDVLRDINPYSWVRPAVKSKPQT